MGNFCIVALLHSGSNRMVDSVNHPDIFTRWTRYVCSLQTLYHLLKYTEIPSKVRMRGFCILMCSALP